MSTVTAEEINQQPQEQQQLEESTQQNVAPEGLSYLSLVQN